MAYVLGGGWHASESEKKRHKILWPFAHIFFCSSSLSFLISINRKLNANIYDDYSTLLRIIIIINFCLLSIRLFYACADGAVNGLDILVAILMPVSFP